MPTMKTLIAGLEPGSAIKSRNLELVPLMRRSEVEPSTDYALASEPSSPT